MDRKLDLLNTRFRARILEREDTEVSTCRPFWIHSGLS
jgi:hypothetical protein